MRFIRIICNQVLALVGIIFIVPPGFCNQEEIQLTDIKSIHETVIHSVNELFRALSVNGNSELKINFKNDDQEILLKSLQKSIVDYLGCGLSIVDKETVDLTEAKFDTNANSGVVQFQLDDAIEYIRLDQFSDGNFQTISSSLSPKKIGKTLAIIWDFRFASHLRSSSLKKYENLIESIERTSFIVLVNHETRGAFEIMVQILRQTDNCIVIGEETYGQSFACKPIPRKSGLFLLIPENTYSFNNGKKVMFAPVKPTIPLHTTGEVIDFTHKIQDKNNVKNDDGVKIVIDLVRAYNLFGEKRF